MRIMAVYTFISNWFMYKFLPFKSICLVSMTLETYIVPCCIKEFWEISLVRVMAHGTAADCDWTMYKFALSYLFVMAQETEIFTICTKLELIRRLMCIMTFRAVSFFYRLMYAFFGVNP